MEVSKYIPNSGPPRPIFGRQGLHSAAAAFYSAKSRQGLGFGGLGGLAIRGSPALSYLLKYVLNV